MNESEALGILEKVLRLADADAAVAMIEGGTQAATRVADNVITQNVERSSSVLTVNCAYGQSHGAASTDDLKPESLKAVVEAAQAIARSMPADPEYMPPLETAEAEKYARVDSFFEQTARLDPLEKAEHIAAAIRTVAGKGLRLSGAYSTGGRFQAVANSAGLRGYHRTTNAEVHLTVLGKTGSGWAEQISNNAQEIEAEKVASEALRISELSENPVDLAPGKYTVIMRPAAVGEMLVFAFWGGIDAKATDEGRTCMRGKLGTRICGELITIRSDPADARCPGPPFQEGGLACPALPWIEHGVLKNLSYSRFWAKKQGKVPTGFPSNVIMDGGTATVNEMVAATERGLLITRFWYIRYVDPMVPSLTGMTRDGLFLIEDGKITTAVKHMRFNESPLDALSRVEAMGPPERTGEYIGMLVPTLKVRDFNFTSATKF
jgi:predicted Zn-dependent protease